MKTSRSELKALVKECLVEILAEGLGATSMSSSPQRGPVSRQTQTSMSRPTMEARRPTQALKAAIRESAGGNKIMEDIFRHTAENTLPGMLSGGDSPDPIPSSGGSKSRIADVEQFNGTPEELFGPMASKWADLAFMPTGPGLKK